MKLILWDFDGTLAYREGMWSGTLADLANQLHPEYQVTVDDLQPSLSTGFPWHSPETYYGKRSADTWWADIHPTFYNAYLQAGVQSDHADSLAKAVRYEYTKIERWSVYNDVVTSLKHFRENGWQHYILSNHVPELRSLVNQLALDKYFEKVFNSAEIGFEKPNKYFFEHVLSELPTHDEIWMIGDSYNADVLGAEQVQIPSILVRKSHASAKLYCSSLLNLTDYIA